MREIKFRAWDTVHNRMYYDGNLITGDVMVMDISGGLQFSANDGTWREKDFILMQYTGLRDKHGKEIYEGDILKMQYQEHAIGVVEYIDNGFWIRGKCNYIPNEANREIIGDIYTTPELLK